MSSETDEILSRIEKVRYLIPCKCSICDKSFDDIMLGTLHITDKHSKRKVKNVIENLSWDVKDDLKKWVILQELRTTREQVIQKLTDINAIDQAKLPDVVEIQRKKANIAEMLVTLQDELLKAGKEPEKAKPEKETEEVEEESEELEEETEEMEEEFEDSEDEIDEKGFKIAEDEEEIEAASTDSEAEEGSEEEEQEETEATGAIKKSKKRNLCELLERELEKYVDSIKRLSMASQVEQRLKSKKTDAVKLYKYAEQLDYYLGIAKAIRIIKASKTDLEIII